MPETTFESEIPLNPLVKRWWERIRLAKDFKARMFQDDADEAMLFFTCNKALDELLWNKPTNFSHLPHDDEEDFPAPRFRIKVGKVAELVELFGPTLYHRNPDIVVEPKTLEIPNELLFPLIPPETVQQAQMQSQQQAQMAQQSGQPPPPPFSMDSLIPPDPDDNKNKLVATLMEYYLNYVQRENDKKTNSRRAIDEALIKGAGILWTEVFSMYEGGPQLVGSFYDTIDNLIVDPDAETIEECWWVARKRIQPYWEVGDKFGLDHQYVHEKCCDIESVNKQGYEINKDSDSKRKLGKTNDLVEYWEIYSRMGMGSRLKGSLDYDMDADEQLVNDTLEKFGDNVYIAIHEKLPHPLNFKTSHLHELTTEPDQELLDQMREEKLNDVSWPIPFWADSQWPFTMIAFHEVPNNPWPMSHIRPGLGYLKFLNWVMSFLINRCRISLRSVAATMKSVGEEVVQNLFSGKDFSVLQLEGNLGADGDINKLVSFLKMPEVNGDVWKVIEAVFDLFEKATGMSGLLYGESGGMRSAEEARIKGGNSNIRSDDMSNKVEDALSSVAKKEAMAARWLLDNRSVAPVLGQRGASLWEQFVQTKDFESVAREYTYRIEAGSTRKPNKESQAQIVQQAIQVIPPLAQLAANPQLHPMVNWFITQWAKANSFELPNPLIPDPVPQPDPMQQKIEAEIQGKQQELQMKSQAQQQDLQMRQQTHEIDLQATQAKAQADVQKAGMEMQVAAAKAQQEGQIAQQKMQQEVTLGKLDMLSQVAQRSQESRLQQQEHQMGLAHEHEKHKQGLQHAEQQAAQARKDAKSKPTGDKK